VADIETECKAVLDLMRASIADSPLGEEADRYIETIGIGKMLRARLALQLGAASGANSKRLRSAGAAVELVHAATLLHDDVIDGGSLRRGLPAFWVAHGTQGAILMGDMLLIKATQIVKDYGDPVLTSALIDLTGEVCMAEVEQELLLRGKQIDWDTCVSLARRKTGSLFAFSACAAATEDDMAVALKEAGYLLGTAYQLGDDFLDASGNVGEAQKTLGQDSLRNKGTAVTAAGPEAQNASEFISNLCTSATRTLEPWPKLENAWISYLKGTVLPLLKVYLDSGS